MSVEFKIIYPGMANAQEELEKWPNNIILCDINNTVTDPKTGDTISVEHARRIREISTLAKKQGWEIMANSDSPYKPLLHWTSTTLGFSSSGIAENGCLLVNNETRNIIIRAMIPNITPLQSDINRRLRNAQFYNRNLLKLQHGMLSPEWNIPNNFTIEETDENRPGQEGDLVYAYAAGRLATQAIFCGELVKKTGDLLTFQPVPEVTEFVHSVLDELRDQKRFPEKCSYYSYPEDGFTAIHPGANKTDVGFNKARAAALLINGFPGRMIWFVGDDYRDGKPSRELLEEYCGTVFSAAVGNASEELKQQADYVSSFPLAIGVVDIILHILNRSD